MRTIYVGCLACRFTGGLTLAHQLCYELNKQGYNAVMYYYFGHGQDKTNPVNKNYQKYNLPFVTKIEDSQSNVVVAPETNVNLLRKVKKAQKYIWWMSVDNYFKTLKSKRYKIEDLFGLHRLNITSPQITHLAQSYYAIDFLRKSGVLDNNIKYLSDYLDPEFILQSENYLQREKRDVVLYNPKKGFEFTSKIIEVSGALKWVPLINLTPEEMQELLGTSKVYIDFGNHPGKDRIPREAAIMGCCVITGKRGSANFHEDVMIPEEYKFEDKLDSIPKIVELIQHCMTNYKERFLDFEQYRAYIKNEQKQFSKDVESVFMNV